MSNLSRQRKTGEMRRPREAARVEANEILQSSAKNEGVVMIQDGAKWVPSRGHSMVGKG